MVAMEGTGGQLPDDQFLTWTGWSFRSLLFDSLRRS